MPYRVRGYPGLQTARPQGTAAELGAGKIDLADEQPALLSALSRVAGWLHRTVTITSGYRTDAYSAAVGGFAGDPHTQGIAADVEVGGQPIGLVPHAMRLLKQAGLVSGNQPGFYRGKPDPGHVQLAAGASSPSVSLESLWTQAGGPSNVARIMAAIALAESGGRVGATHQNADGSIDRGLWQINSSHAAYDPGRLTSDPLYNARAAVAVYRSQGLGAWTTYTSGAYRQYLPRASSAVAQGVAPGVGARNRPSAAGGDPGQNELAAWYDYLYPHGPTDLLLPGSSSVFGDSWNPLDVFRSAAGAVSDVGTFLKWVAWLFHPRNILRAVEFFAGVGLMAVGVKASLQAFELETPAPVRAASQVIELTPAGRALGVRKAAREGRRAARSAHVRNERSTAKSKARKSEATRLSNRDFERRSGKRKGPSDEIPF